ncbi:transcriptional regulator [Buttiauxella warmboldiae]|uniref:Transcriptional regulator n=1 Tax=Buttiauxella warmboldiae TaxID=82993 RepID=A0A3N5EC59_9ENTR|nr:helix-turn-helix transcriptional regulator [Buttiauxella warmboldiae]RPH29256.1 transcriptional regulator [Buttiauxella warmboldiae]
MIKQDWNPADIIAALHKCGTSMAAVSREVGLASSTLANALSRRWPKGEWLIATALNIHPAEIWPSRYARQEKYRLPKHPWPGMKLVVPATYFPVPEKHSRLARGTVFPA